MEKLSEVELGELLIPWLENKGWEIYQEVKFGYGGNVADIVAMKDEEMWIIELKTSLSLKVMEQAWKWKDAHYKSIAVPYSRRRNDQFASTILRHFGIGYIEIGTDYIREHLPGVMQEFKKEHYELWMLPYITELHKTYSKAGSKHGGHITAYRMTIIMIQDFLKENPGSTLNEIIDNVGIGHYSSERSAKGSLRVAFKSYERAWCRIEYGKHTDWKNQYYIKQEDQCLD